MLPHNQLIVNFIFEQLLSGEDFSTLEIVNQEGQVEKLATKDELPYFAPLPDDDEEDVAPLVSERICFLQIARADLDSKDSWRFTEDGKEYPAVIEDGKFLRAITEGAPVSSKDILQVVMQEEQSITKGNMLKTKRIIKQVLNHKRSAIQGRLLEN